MGFNILSWFLWIIELLFAHLCSKLYDPINDAERIRARIVKELQNKTIQTLNEFFPEDITSIILSMAEIELSTDGFKTALQKHEDCRDNA